MNKKELGMKFASHTKWVWQDKMKILKTEDETTYRDTTLAAGLWLHQDIGYRFDMMPIDKETETPDIEDPATLRLILELIRERYPLVHVVLQPCNFGIRYDVIDGETGNTLGHAHEEAEALWMAFNA